MKGKKIFWGLFFVLAAVLVIINQLELFTGISIISILFTVLLLAVLIKSLTSLSYFGILFSIAFLAIIYAEPLSITNLTPWPVLIAALLGSIGLSIIFGKSSHHKKEEKYFEKEVIDINSTNVVDINISFGASAKYINAKDLEKVNVNCKFGAAKVYLENAQLKADTINVDLEISFSGVELYIPKNWKIDNRVNCSLGGIEEKNFTSSECDKTLILTGKVNLAGVEIIYV